LARPPAPTPTDTASGVRPVAKVPAPSPMPSPETLLEVSGKTQPVPGRVGHIAPAVLHPVTGVLVALGDRVKAGQRLVTLDADEPEAEVRAKRAALAELEAG